MPMMAIIARRPFANSAFNFFCFSFKTPSVELRNPLNLINTETRRPQHQLAQNPLKLRTQKPTRTLNPP